MNKYDIRHKETLRLFLKEYFELFFPELAERIKFETVKFLDKELLAVFDQPADKAKDEAESPVEEKDVQRITDALILLELELNGQTEWILIYWEQQSTKIADYEKRMFHCFCGIYFRFQKPVFPIAMFTDDGDWKKPVKSQFEMFILDYPIVRYHYQLIKLKRYQSSEFEKRINQNPLAAAYLPLTKYRKEERPEIMAKAIEGIARKVKSSQKRAILISLVEITMNLNKEEKDRFKNIINTDNQFKEAKMLQSVEEWGIEQGIEQGIEKGIEKGEKSGKLSLVKKQLQIKFGDKAIGYFPLLESSTIDQLEKTAENLMKYPTLEEVLKDVVH